MNDFLQEQAGVGVPGDYEQAGVERELGELSEVRREGDEVRRRLEEKCLGLPFACPPVSYSLSHW